MTPAVIAALSTAIPAVLGAITALVIALRSNGTANNAAATAADVKTTVIDHVLTPHAPVATAPVEVVTEGKQMPIENAPEEKPEEQAAPDGRTLMGLPPAPPQPVQPAQVTSPVETAPEADKPADAPVAPPTGDPAAEQAKQALTDAGNALLKIAESL